MARKYDHASKLWSVAVTNFGETFQVNVWSDTQAGAERKARATYPDARLISADDGDVGWDYEGEG